MKVKNNGNFVANGMVVKNCDSLRYAIATHKVSVYDPYEHAKQQESWMKNKYEPTRGFR